MSVKLFGVLGEVLWSCSSQSLRLPGSLGWVTLWDSARFTETVLGVLGLFPGWVRMVWQMAGVHSLSRAGGSQGA